MATSIPKTSYRTSPALFVMPGRNPISTPTSLVEAVQLAVQPIEENWFQPIAARTARVSFRRRVMLPILAYCYAKQVCGASEIPGYLFCDAAYCRICRSEFPNVPEVEPFRPHNRQVIAKCLIIALRLLGEQHIAKGFVTRIHKTLIAEETKRRIIMAACADSLERKVRMRTLCRVTPQLNSSSNTKNQKQTYKPGTRDEKQRS